MDTPVKVTNPAKMVTDSALLAHLEKHGIDKDCVELIQDYGAPVKGVSSPYARFYRHNKALRCFAVISSLPMADASGTLVEVGWESQDSRFSAKNNLFSALVEGTELTITARNARADGKQAGHHLVSRPQIFLNGVEVKPSSPVASLVDDPFESEYKQNVLEWDYGICLRRLRIIEGQIQGSWVFVKPPGASVKIVYNQSGDFILKLGKYAVDKDTEEVPSEIFAHAEYPFTIADSATFYPDADPETSTVDGYTATVDAGRSWAGTIGAAGSAHGDSDIGGTSATGSGYQAYSATNQWYYLLRDIFLFDTSSLPDAATVTAATLSIYGTGKENTRGDAAAWNIYAATPASNNALSNSDFTQVGSTPFAAAISYANWNTSGYNDFVFNASGLAAVSLTSISKFCLRESVYDVGGATPTWEAWAKTAVWRYFSEKGSGYKPKLVVTYSTSTPISDSDTSAGQESSALILKDNFSTESGVGADSGGILAAKTSAENGFGSEFAGLVKTLYSTEAGLGADALKIKIQKAGSDLRRRLLRGQAGLPHKEVEL
jgi:hypothetical protein